ncbi:MAG: sialate O-acetylesterase [Bythopirellula sp.]
MFEGHSQTSSVFVLTGQSNALGTTSLEEIDYSPGSHMADGEVRCFWSNVNAANTGYPPQLCGTSGVKFLPLQMQQGEGDDPQFWGPEFGFARAMHDAGWSRLLIIKACRGGGGNTYWHRQTFLKDAARGHMWGHLCNVMEQSLDVLSDSGEKFLVRGFIHLQGESNNPHEAEIAGERLRELIDDLKKWLDHRFPQVASGMLSVVAEIAASQLNRDRAETLRQHVALAKEREDLSFVATRDLALKSDSLHFGRDAKLEIGRRLALAFISSPQLQ